MKNEDGQWVYYSRLVPGYEEKYGIRNIRRRNASILRKCQKGDPLTQCALQRERIAENNLPLARMVAEKWSRMNGWDRNQTEDAYQECCYALVMYIDNVFPDEVKELTGAYFSKRIYVAMNNRLTVLHNRNLPKNQLTFIPFDENDFPTEKETTPNREFIVEEFIPNLPNLTERSKGMLLEYFFGNTASYIEGFQLEDIAFHYGLTRERCRQIIQKALKNATAYTKHSFKYRTGIMPEDFFKEQ